MRLGQLVCLGGDTEKNNTDNDGHFIFLGRLIKEYFKRISD